MQISGKVAVITGASSGIGRALAVQLGIKGAKVVVASRSLEFLSDTALLLKAYGIDHLVVQLDVTQDASIENLLRQVLNIYSAIDIFVNNAGLGLFESVVSSRVADVQAVFNTNFWGAFQAIQRVVPLLNNNGKLVNISSAAAKYAPYRQGIYAASKAALERVTEAVALEERHHMTTLLVIPDRTDTPFMNNVVGPKDNKLALKLKAASTEAVANRISWAIEKDREICYTTWKSRMYAVLSATCPSIVKAVIGKTAQ